MIGPVNTHGCWCWNSPRSCGGIHCATPMISLERLGCRCADYFKVSLFGLSGGSAVVLMSCTIFVVTVGRLPGKVVRHIVSEYARG